MADSPVLIGVPRCRRPPAWTARAACSGRYDPDGNDCWHDRSRWPLARGICAACPVLDACLQYALKVLAACGPPTGMLAGLTPAELVRAARAAGLPAQLVAQHGTRPGYVKGCRCPPCRAANSAAEHERRITRAGQATPSACANAPHPIE